MNKIQGSYPIVEAILRPRKSSQTVPQISQTNISKLLEEKFHADGNVLAKSDVRK
jgi:hypothetical protein